MLRFIIKVKKDLINNIQEIKTYSKYSEVYHKSKKGLMCNIQEL